jgi:hypothetical protein
MIQDDAAFVKRVLSGEKSAFGPLIERNSMHEQDATCWLHSNGFCLSTLDREDFSQSCLCASFGPSCFLVTL